MADALDAVLASPSEASALEETVAAGEAREIMHLNLLGLASVGVTALVVLLSMIWGSGVLTGDDGDNMYSWWQVPLHQRHSMDLNMTGMRSTLPEDGPYNWSGPTEHFVEVQLPASEQDAGYPGPALMHIALWMPDVDNDTKVPVIATIHPYYDFGGEGIAGPDSNPNTIPDAGVGQWILDEFVPHGYALAQVSTFGTGQSTHCQDVKGLGEQIGIQAAVQWLGEQDWSNGNIGLMGKSYAGTTNWEAAQNPSEHLRTIVPISGSIGVQQMFYRNGSSESRAMVYDALYEGATADATEDDMRMCSDDAIGPLSPWTTWAAAGLGGDQWNDYWDERYHLQDVLDNYEGSVYLVWGMQDWNVDPYHAFPTYQMLRDAGIHTRGIMGQWAHNYPDQPDRHGDLTTGYGAEAYPNTSRMDWAIELYNWFEFYLKGVGVEPEAHVQIQTHDGKWHVEETWPPADLSWWRSDLGAMQSNGEWVSITSSASITVPSFEETTHISGMPTMHLSVSPGTCNGGQVFATMFDDETGVRLGHATMDVRYRDGGYDAQTVIPYQTYMMRMEFNPLDVVLPAGHAIRIDLTETGEDYLSSPCAAIGMAVHLDDRSELGLPIIDRPTGDARWFDVPPWWEHQEPA